MQQRNTHFFQALIVLGDLLLLSLSFFVAGALRFDEIRLQETAYYNYYVQLFMFFNLLWLCLALLLRTFDLGRFLEPRKSTGKVINAFFLHLFILALLLVLLKKDEYSRLFLLYFYTSFFVLLLPWRFFFFRLLKSRRLRGWRYSEAVLIGSGSGVAQFYNTVHHRPEFGLKFAAIFADEQTDLSVDGSEAEAKGFLISQSKDLEVYVAFPPGDERIYKWFRFADDHALRFRMIPTLGLERSAPVEIDFYHDIPVLTTRKEPLARFHNRLLKQFIDLTVSLLVILFIYPWLFPILALGVRLSGAGPIFYKQARSGFRNKNFLIHKFRSMHTHAGTDEERTTAFGKFLRKHHLDELPQFINVLQGHMSVVGPRPHMLEHTEAYRKKVDRYMVRHLAKPGITGLAQVQGLAGSITSVEDIEERVKADVYYIENWSVLLDIKVMLLTVWRMVFPGKN